MLRIIFFLIFTSFVLSSQSCRQSIKPTSHADTGDSIKKETNTGQEKQIQTIKEFYTAYILECDKPLPLDLKKINSIKSKYLTKKLQEKLKEADLDYDPILNAQDCDKKWIETLRISPDTEQKNIYIISYMDDYNRDYNQIRLTVTKVGEKYLIDDIEID
ncbi:MAG: DUF3828 domain-containing protein [Dysgonomonas sp.]